MGDTIWVLIEDSKKIGGVFDDWNEAAKHAPEEIVWKTHKGGNLTWVSEENGETLAIVCFEMNTYYPFDPPHLFKNEAP